MNSENIMNMEFGEETAGSLMSSEYIRIPMNYTVDKAIVYLRQHVKGKANIHYIYVVDDEGHLVGVTSLRELLGARGELPLSSIMKVKITLLNAYLDQEKAAKVFQDSDLVTVPVVDEENHMLGVIHVDTMMDVMQQEATEDIHKMASMTSGDPQEGGLLGSSITWLYSRRIGWLIILVFVNLLSGTIIAGYEDLIGKYVILVFFLPLLIASGGNAGSQSTTLVIRSMAVGDITKDDWLPVIFKEFGTALLLGLTMAVAIAGIGFYRGLDTPMGNVSVQIAITVGLSMTVVVLFGGLVGAILPFIFRFLKLDPATASTPLVTSICDIAGVFIYFWIASVILQLDAPVEAVETIAMLFR